MLAPEWDKSRQFFTGSFYITIGSNMVVVWCARFVLLVLIAISVEKPAFLNRDSVCYDLNERSPIVFEQNHLYSSIW